MTKNNSLCKVTLVRQHFWFQYVPKYSRIFQNVPECMHPGNPGYCRSIRLHTVTNACMQLYNTAEWKIRDVVTLYSAQPYKPEFSVQCRQRKQDFIFYFIILYKCTLQPAACMEKKLIGLKGCCHWHWELKSSVLLWWGSWVAHVILVTAF